MGLLVWGLIAVPPLAGALLASLSLVAAWRPLSAHRARASISYGVTLTAAALATLCALALLPRAGSGPAFTIEWLPGAGPMVVGLGATGLYAALATTGSCALALFGTRSGWVDPKVLPSPGRADPGTGARASSARAEGAPWSAPLTLLAIAAAHVAFLAEHFLARYVALEVVALCVALAPLAESASGARLTRTVYLILRLGDAGLLVAILMLLAAGDTLDIAAALEAGSALDPARLSWVVAAFLLAVWVKVGGWPLHVWSQVGRRLTLFSHSWLYATLMPNLSVYLLYRVTPLLVLTGALQRTALWMGAAGAALAALIALASILARGATKPADLRSALVYLGAAQGGLALVTAAVGLRLAVWLSLLVVAPVRLLLFLAADAAHSEAHTPVGHPRSHSPVQRKVAAGLFAVGGLALTAFDLLTTWWARQAGAPLDVLLVAEFAVATIGIWTVRATWQLWRAPSATSNERPAHPASYEGWRRWMIVGLLGCGVLVSGSLFGPLIRHLAAVAHGASPAVPAPHTLLRYAGTTPAFLMTVVLALAAWRLRWRPRAAPLDVLAPSASAEQALWEQAYDLEEGLTRAAEILRTVVEVGIQERIIAGVVRAVLGGARVTHRLVEQQVLEGTLRRVAQGAIGGGRLAYQVLEQGGLEGLLRCAVRAVLAASRWMQRWHTGRLRRNLLWVAASLALAVLTLALCGW